MTNKSGYDALRSQSLLPNLYDRLGVAQGATAREVQLAYRALATIVHPDRCDVPGASDILGRFSEAYAVLSDKADRRRYDAVNRTAEKARTICGVCSGSRRVQRQRGFTKKVWVACPDCSTN